MKQLVRLIGVSFVVATLGTTAFAGTQMYSGKEMKQVAPVAPTCDFTWTGFYLGGNAGYGWGDGNTDFDPLPDPTTFANLAPTTLHPDAAGFIGGGQLGYNYQWNWLVLGLETDFQGTDIEGSDRVDGFAGFTAPPTNPDRFLEAHERMQWLGTVRGRIGFAPICRLLIYGTGGLAYGNVDLNNPFACDWISVGERTRLLEAILADVAIRRRPALGTASDLDELLLLRDELLVRAPI